MPGLPATGTLAYNGYTFDGSTKVACEVEHVKDEAERTVLYHKHTITAVAIVTATSTDSSVWNIRRKLGEQGRKLVFINKGFGDDLVVSPTGPLRDVKWGPKPEVLSWEPIGSQNACEITWRVTTCVPICDSVARQAGIMALNFEVKFGISDQGFTTRTITGYLEIAQTRSGRAVRDTVDSYRERIAPDRLANFKRNSEWSDSKDRSRSDFTITDVEIPSPNPYPRNIVDIDGRHRTVWRRGGGQGAIYRNVITMDVTRKAGISGAEAWAVFVSLVRQRLLEATYHGRTVLLDELSAEETVFGYPASFMAGYRVLNAEIGNFVAENGLFTRLGTDWNLWQASMSDIYDQRGVAQLRVRPNNDAIVDLCQRSAGALTTDRPSVRTLRAGLPADLHNEIPPPEKSWLDYEAQITPHYSNSVARQSSLSAAEKQPARTGLQFGGQRNGPLDLGQGHEKEDLLSRCGGRRHSVRFTGRAIRAGHDIPRPGLARIGRQTPVEVFAVFPYRVIGNWFGVPIFRLDWLIDYMLPNNPGAIRPPDKIDEGVSTRQLRGVRIR